MSKNPLILTVALLFSVCLAATLQTDAITADSESSFDKSSTRKVIKREYTDISDKNRWEVKASYPELWFGQCKPAEAFNRAAKSLAMDQVKDFKESMSELTEEDKKRLPSGMNYNLEVGYSIEFANDELISVHFGRSEFTGGAHPNHWSVTLNYDLKNSKVLKLNELFASGSDFLKIISKNSIEQIKKRQGEYADADWIKRGAGETLENFKDWNFTKDGLKFTFDAYQVGPYVAGSFESLVPYEKFPQSIRSDKFYSVSEISHIGGNPPNWCRNGHFPQYEVKFKLARIKGKRGDGKQRTYFYRDGDDCPNGKNCREKKYVIPSDEVIVARDYGGFSCVWYQPRRGDETVGWVKTDELSMNKAPIKPGRIKWNGKWEFGESEIQISPTKILGNFLIKGTSLWRGLGDNVHIGELDFVGTANKDKLKAGTGDDKYDCRVKMQRLGRYLIVSDNKNCGGMNVTFDGVYLKK